MTWTHPDDSLKIKIPIDGDYFQPNTKYTVKIIPKGEIEGIPSDPILFETGEGVGFIKIESNDKVTFKDCCTRPTNIQR
jgi:hypothetical protein